MRFDILFEQCQLLVLIEVSVGSNPRFMDLSVRKGYLPFRLFRATSSALKPGGMSAGVILLSGLFTRIKSCRITSARDSRVFLLSFRTKGNVTSRCFPSRSTRMVPPFVTSSAHQNIHRSAILIASARADATVSSFSLSRSSRFLPEKSS